MYQLKIVLFQPEIPHNAGAALRICAGLNAQLHMIRPLGFTINDKHLKRVALGYHNILHPVLHNNMAIFLSSLDRDEKLLLFSSKANLALKNVSVTNKMVLLFGSETNGMKLLTPEFKELLAKRSLSVKIPQAKNFRCHNLSNSIAMGAYEIYRQWDFPDLA